MTTARSLTLRWGSYPLVFGANAAAQLAIAAGVLPYWPLAPLFAALGIAAVAVLERWQPYEAAWLADHGDTRADILHAAVSLSLLFVAAEIVAWCRLWLPSLTLWPAQWPLWAQVLLAGAIIDFGLWLMHWLSHRQAWLWRLHALHHSSERLYWLNGERRHPLSALLLAAPGLTAAMLLGAPPAVVGCWFSIVAVHLAFQHSNLDYSVGPLRWLLGVAEIHRWHHKREYENAQVNFGEFWMLWDHVFGTYRYLRNGVHAGEVGMSEPMPGNYLAQLRWPFSKANAI